MAFTAKDIADWFLSRLNTDSGDTMSPLKLQKLLYYAQAWHLTIFREPLFDEPIQAWAHGPVVPSQYHRFVSLTKFAPIAPENFDVESPDVPSSSEDLLRDVALVYGEHQASYLEELTHNEAPWIIARGGLPAYERCTTEISHQSMIDYYSEKLRNEQGQEAAA